LKLSALMARNGRTIIGTALLTGWPISATTKALGHNPAGDYRF